MDGLFLLNVVSPTEAHEGLMSICGARLARVKRVVYMSVQGADDAAYLPHFGSKVGVEAGVKASQTKLLGHPPRRFEDYVRETAGAWKASA